MRNANNEQFIVLTDLQGLRQKSLEYLKRSPSKTLHTNRVIDTGWQSMKFDFTLTDEHFMTCFFSRVVRDESDLVRLETLLEKTKELYESGIKQNNIVFSLKLIFNKEASSAKPSIDEVLKKYNFVEESLYL